MSSIFCKIMPDRRLALAVAFGCAVSPAQADGLRIVDLATVPIEAAELQGGTHLLSHTDMIAEEGSRVVYDCTDCGTATQALISVRVENQGETFFFEADPEEHAANVQAYCETVAENCAATLVETDGLAGYGFTALWDGGYLVEHSYFSDGLVLVVSAQSADPDASAANHAYLLDLTIPYVTGETQ